jgi:hypothetical protein
MSKSRLFSGKIKKLSGDKLTVDRYEYLDVSQAEPDLGLPAFNNAVLIGEINGQRFWSNTLTNLTISASTLTNTFITNSTLSNSVINSGTITGNLLPSVTDAYNLGSPTQRFKTLYVSSATIDIGGVTISSSGTDALNISKLIVTTSTNSTSTVTGALVINGGVGIGQDLWIGGDIYSTRLDISGIALSNISGALGVSTVNVTSSTNSTSTNSGALIVNGGVGIGKNLYVGSDVHSKNIFIDTLTTGSIVVAYNNGKLITPGTFLRWITPGNILSVNGSLELSNTATFTSTQSSVSTSTGALTVAGGVGIGGDLYVGGEIVAQKLTIEYTTVTTTYIVTDDIISTTNTTPSTNTQTGALVVAGGVGIGGTLTGKTINADRVNAGEVFDNFNRVLTRVTPHAGTGISISTPAYTSADISFTVTNIGVLSVTAGTDTAVSTSTGNITIWNTSALQTVSDRGNSTTNIISIVNKTSATSTTTGALTVAGGVGIIGDVWVGGIIHSRGELVLTPSNVNEYTNKTIINAGTDTAINTNTGIISIWNTSTLQSVTGRGNSTTNAIFILNTDNAVSTNSGALQVVGGLGVGGDVWTGGKIYAADFIYSNGQQVITTATINQFANQTSIIAGTDTAVSTSTGNITIWNTSTFQTISDRGNSTTNIISIVNKTSATSTVTGALTVAGGVGIGGDLYIGGNLDVKGAIVGGAIVVTTATIYTQAATSITAGTDTAVSTSTGAITIWNTSTLQSVTGRGNSTTNAISITNTTSATSTITGALTVAGGAGIGGDLYVSGKIVAQELDIQYTTITTTLVVTDDIISTYNTTNSTSTNSGALIVAGGVGVGGDMRVGGKIYSTVTNAEHILNNTATSNTSYYLGLLDKVGQQSSVNSDNALKYITSSTTTATSWTSGTNVLSVPGSVYSVDGNSDLGNLLYTPKVTVGPIPHTRARPSDFWVDPSTSAIYQWILDAGNGYWLQIAVI